MSRDSRGNCTVCGWPLVVYDGDHAWWCDRVRAWLSGPASRIDFVDVAARRAAGERWASIAADYGCATSTMAGYFREWQRDQEPVA